MKSNNFKLLSILAAFAFGLASSAQAAFVLDNNFVTYGDGNSYALQVSGVIAGDTGPGSAFYVNSTPGAIQDLIVVATGASGMPVNTNFAGMDNALSTPSGVSGSNFFSGLWNSTLAAFTNYLGGENPLFFFNNNQVNSGASTNQSLAVWAQISLTGANQQTLFFDFTNNNSKYALVSEGGGGVFQGNVANYTSTGAGPIAGTNNATDYVLSGGAICLSAMNVPISCSNPGAVTGPINNNLGANQAAYAIDAPELNAFLTAWAGGGFAGYDAIQIDLRFGCDPGTGVAGQGDCVGRDANNGFEQLFIGTSRNVTQVPEPSVLSLIGLGLLWLAVIYRRRV